MPLAESRRVRTTRALPFLLLAALPLAGCQLNTRPGAESLLEAARDDIPPGESAAMALDPYDANRRAIGTLTLANQPFAREAVYIRLFVDNAADADPLVRQAALRGLAIHGRPEHATILAAALTDAVPAVRLEAARGLQRLHNPATIEALLIAAREPDALRERTSRGVRISEPDAQVRAEAASALGQYPDARVLQTLVAALDDSDLSVNRAALGSLRFLTGQDLGVDRQAWTGWLRETKEPFRARSAYVFPVFNRERRLWEYVPFLPQPPNEVPGTPAGLPRS